MRFHFYSLFLPLALIANYPQTSSAEDPRSNSDFPPGAREAAEKLRDRFSLAEWQQSGKDDNPPGTVLSRTRLFRNFLRQYNLIGMTHEQVKKLLGNEDLKATYSIVKGGDGGWGLYIVYENERVKGWRFKSYINDEPTPLITTNVLWHGQGGTPDQFTPKQDSSKTSNHK